MPFISSGLRLPLEINWAVGSCLQDNRGGLSFQASNRELRKSRSEVEVTKVELKKDNKSMAIQLGLVWTALREALQLRGKLEEVGPEWDFTLVCETDC